MILMISKLRTIAFNVFVINWKAKTGKNTLKYIYYDLIQREELYKVPKSFPVSPDGKSSSSKKILGKDYLKDVVMRLFFSQKNWPSPLDNCLIRTLFHSTLTVSQARRNLSWRDSCMWLLYKGLNSNKIYRKPIKCSKKLTQTEAPFSLG